MFIESFTEHSRRAIILARQICIDSNFPNLDTDCLFLGLITRRDTDAFTVLNALYVDVTELEHRVRNNLSEVNINCVVNNNDDIPFTKESKAVLELSLVLRDNLGKTKVNTIILLLAIFKDGTSKTAEYLRDMGIVEEDILDCIKNSAPKRVTSTGSRQQNKTEHLDKFSVDLTKKAKAKLLDPVLCRERELMRLIQILGRRSKNNPILIGEPGVGKTAIVEGLAQMIVDNKVPNFLKNARIVSLDIGLMIAGTKWRGQFEERLKLVLKDISSDDNIITFIDEIHTIIGAGSAEGSSDMSNIIKPHLSRGELRCIGATTAKEYKRFFEKDGALERRFQQIKVDPLTVDDTITILKAVSPRYETFHNINIADGVLEKVARLSNRYVHDRHLPDKAIDVLDESCVRVSTNSTATTKTSVGNLNEKFKKCSDYKEEKKLREQLRNVNNKTSILTQDVVLDVIYSMTGVPIHELNENLSSKIKKMDIYLNKKIIGQEKAIKTLSRSVKKSMIGISDPNRPMGSFIFLGPSGVGKTELGKCLSEALFGNSDSIVQLDMTEYNEKFSSSRMVGSPPGYIGYDEGGQLTEKIRKNPYSVILVDEIEKAHPEVMNMFLQILEEGHLTDGQGRKVDFKNTIIIMTSNVGTDAFTGMGSLGFVHNGGQNIKIEQNVLDELSRRFPVEFINRIDNIIVFNSLDKDAIRDIINLQIDKLNKRLESRNIKISLEPSAIDWLTEEGYDKKYGARYLNRCIKTHIEDEISEKIIEEDVITNEGVVDIIIESDGINLYLHTVEEVNV